MISVERLAPRLLKSPQPDDAPYPDNPLVLWFACADSLPHRTAQQYTTLLDGELAQIACGEGRLTVSRVQTGADYPHLSEEQKNQFDTTSHDVFYARCSNHGGGGESDRDLLMVCNDERCAVVADNFAARAFSGLCVWCE